MGKYGVTRLQIQPAKITTCLLCVLLFSPPASAQIKEAETSGKNQEIVQAFIAQGMEASAQGDIEKAVNDFSRALLLDTFNETAKGKLLLLNQEGHFSAQRKTQLFLLEDHFSFLENLRNKSVYFDKKCAALKEDLLKRGYEKTFLEEKLSAIKMQYLPPEEKVIPVEHPSDPLAALNASLDSEREWLFSGLTCLQKQHEWLKNFSKEGQAASPAKIAFDDTQDLETPVAVVSISFDEHSQDKPPRPVDEAALLRQELLTVRKQLDDLQKHVEEKDRKVVDLTKQIVDFSLKLAEKEAVLSEKVDSLSSLSVEYKDLQSRFELGQKIIRERDTQVQALQDSLAALQLEGVEHQRRMRGILAHKDEELAELQGILRIYSEKLGDTHREARQREEDMASLREQLSSLRLWLFFKETALEKTRERLALLEKEFIDAQKRFFELQKE